VRYRGRPYKIRQLAALLGDALAQRAPVVLTTGAVQSNHCALTAITAAMHVFQV
jgi:1-aminocyclopropane-1-carboxylate deaminase/D-cysteine desulfhydrase-like pyridoxal-dependent ACC family enzyme